MLILSEKEGLFFMDNTETRKIYQLADLDIDGFVTVIGFDDIMYNFKTKV